jgi:probable HAF family extracellular repeat protein
MRTVSVRVVACLATSLSLVSMGAAPRTFEGQEERAYRIDELRDLGGSDARGNSINDWAMVAGYSQVENSAARHATVWLFGHPFDMGTLGGTHSNITWPGQNNTGLVVGIAQTAKPQTRSDGWSCRGFFPAVDQAKYTCLGVAWEWGRARPLTAFGGDNSFAASANNRRQVVGWAETRRSDPSCNNPADRGFRAVLWDLNDQRTVELPPYDQDSASAATAINDRGQVVGISGSCDQSIGRHSAKHAVLWKNGEPIVLESDATSWNTPTSITPRGDIIVGFANAPDGDPVQPTLRAVLWTMRDDLCPKVPGTNMCDLGTIDDDATAQAWGVNERGQVVGTSCGQVCRAFIWEKGVMRDLNDRKGTYPNRLENAMGINDRGQISGRARTATNEGVAFVARPVR